MPDIRYVLINIPSYVLLDNRLKYLLIIGFSHTDFIEKFVQPICRYVLAHVGPYVK